MDRPVWSSEITLMRAPAPSAISGRGAIARAKALIQRAKKRDRVAVLEVLKQARVYINGFLKSDFSYDAERMIYLEFVEKALGKILSGKKPQLALYMDNENRPLKIKR